MSLTSFGISAVEKKTQTRKVGLSDQSLVRKVDVDHAAPDNIQPSGPDYYEYGGPKRAEKRTLRSLKADKSDNNNLTPSLSVISDLIVDQTEIVYDLSVLIKGVSRTDFVNALTRQGIERKFATAISRKMPDSIFNSPEVSHQWQMAIKITLDSIEEGRASASSRSVNSKKSIYAESDKTRDAVTFYREEWAEEIANGTVTQALVRSVDPGLLNAMRYRCERDGLDAKTVLPPAARSGPAPSMAPDYAQTEVAKRRERQRTWLAQKRLAKKMST